MSTFIMELGVISFCQLALDNSIESPLNRSYQYQLMFNMFLIKASSIGNNDTDYTWTQMQLSV